MPRVALVTGGTRGIGAAISKALKAAGYKVAANYGGNDEVARTFKAVAESLMQVHGPGQIEYIPFPGDLKNRYQHYTQADVSGLRDAGYTAPFTALEDGVRQTFAEEPVV